MKFEMGEGRDETSTTATARGFPFSDIREKGNYMTIKHSGNEELAVVSQMNTDFFGSIPPPPAATAPPPPATTDSSTSGGNCSLFCKPVITV
ncbi:hypothetical protein L2E82_41412 [Cichorium intybus]|uniref:Uncharacterized protein n=1 Tax=Cichorium intybus TaxID=13427 RepID=A0ACB9ANF8_CICIN|nr:hypothetical protein L2E82_41412 [Cichorium intybus]